MEGSTPSSPQFNLIQRLPVELQLNIFQLLGYIDAIRLSQINQYFHTNIDPGTWPRAIKEVDLLQAERWPVHNRVCDEPYVSQWNERETVVISDGYACFSCYRILDKSAFSRTQTGRKRAKESKSYKHTGCKRFCIDCGVREGKYRLWSFLDIATTQNCMISVSERNLGGVRPIRVTTSLVVCPLCSKACEYDDISPPILCKRCVPDETEHSTADVRAKYRRLAPVVIECKRCKRSSEMGTRRRWTTCARCSNTICKRCHDIGYTYCCDWLGQQAQT